MYTYILAPQSHTVTYTYTYIHAHVHTHTHTHMHTVRNWVLKHLIPQGCYHDMEVFDPWHMTSEVSMVTVIAIIHAGYHITINIHFSITHTMHAYILTHTQTYTYMHSHMHAHSPTDEAAV